jgi:hypothetical protein
MPLANSRTQKPVKIATQLKLDMEQMKYKGQINIEK